jgi:hypothetical protein
MLHDTRKSHLIIGAITCLLTVGFLAGPVSAKDTSHRGGSRHRVGADRRERAHHQSDTRHRVRDRHRGFTSRSAQHAPQQHEQRRGNQNASRNHFSLSWEPAYQHQSRGHYTGRSRSHSVEHRGGDSYSHKSGVRFGLSCDSRPHHEVRRRWVPGHYETRTEKVCVRGGYYETRTTRTWVRGYSQTYTISRPHRHGPSCSIHASVRF